jgi:hypothetical protein
MDNNYSFKTLENVLKDCLVKFTSSILNYQKNNIPVDDLVGKYMSKLSNIYNLNQLIQRIDINENCTSVNYTNYVKIFKGGLNAKSNNFDLAEFGMLIYLLPYCEYDTNVIFSTASKSKPINNKEVKSLLQITNEKTRHFILSCLEKEFIIKRDLGRVKSTFIFSPNYFLKGGNQLDLIDKYSLGNSHKFKTKILLNLNKIENDFFCKKEKSQRISLGKEKLGFLMKLVLMMNSQNILKKKSHSNIRSYIIQKFHSKKGEYFLSELESNNYIKFIEDGKELLINPRFARYPEKYYWNNSILELFN